MKHVEVIHTKNVEASYLALASASSWPLLDTSSKPPIRCLKELQKRQKIPKELSKYG